MNADVLPHDPQAVLSAANVPHGEVLTSEQVDLGGLCRVVTARTHAEAILYGEFTVDATTLDDHDPGELQFDEAALRGVVEDWGEPDDDTVTLSAYVYLEAHEHGPLGLTLGEAITVLNHLRVCCLAWLHATPDPEPG